MTLLRRGCLILLVAVVLLAAGRLIYGLTRPSALGQLARFAQTERTTDLARIQAALLRQLPVGTPASTLARFLSQADVPTDVELMLHARATASASRASNNYMSCYPTDFAYGITCRIVDDPDRLTFPCRDAFAIAFAFDRYDTLQSITVEDDSWCL